MDTLHRYSCDIKGMEPPRRFTCPFRYEPHPLCVAAAGEVRRYLASQPRWRRELAAGKMLGVLVVDDGDGRRGFLAAFSGTLAGSAVHDYFVPPVCDIYAPGSEFRRGERAITALNRRIEAMETDENYRRACDELARLDREQADRERAFAARRDEAKRCRDALRAEGITVGQERELIAQSQWYKAELKRIRREGERRHAEAVAGLAAHEALVVALKRERKARSEALQRRLFEMFVVTNARGESADLLTVFERERHCLPPAGAGECCAPRLLQYAFAHGLKPLCMAEFWVGDGGGLRRNGNFYPACDSKCRPILNFMLRGMDVDDPFATVQTLDVPIVYRDEWIVVVDKPAGLLSVPGRLAGTSVETLLASRGINARAAHRLDMDTSGLLVLATTPEVYRLLQGLFAARKVEKTYEALVVGIPSHHEGTISLPLAPDYDNRPLQRVDRAHGAPATTHYRVLAPDNAGRHAITRLELRPATGRTHQLRLHCASPMGLNTPILGDPLYNNTAPSAVATPSAAAPSRLHLHARSLAFRHPVTGAPLHLTAPTPF